MTPSSSYQLPQENQKLATDAQNMARKDVQALYPDIFREQGEIEDHARAVAEEAVDHSSILTNDRQAYIDQFTSAYTPTYLDEVQRQDSQQNASQHNPEEQ